MFPKLDTVVYMERLITDDHSGVEAGGNHFGNDAGGRRHYVLPDEWLRRVARTVRQVRHFLMIVDDVQVGASRTGWFFSFDAQASRRTS